MRRAGIDLGGRYIAIVQGQEVVMRVTADHCFRFGPDGKYRHLGWTAVNESTGRELHIKSAARLKRRVE